MRGLPTYLFLATLAVPAAAATDLCAALGRPDAAALAPALAGAAEFQGCRASSRPGERTVCGWQFALADPESRRAFAGTAARVGQCAGLQSRQRDRGVNHPDFYDAWLYRFAAQRVSLAIKDKSALKSTLVTLRVFWAD